MTKEDFDILSQNIKKVTEFYEDKPFTMNMRCLKEGFSADMVEGTPMQYVKIMSELEELSRETRILFICTALNRICEEEGKLYEFHKPYQANMQYDAVFKKNGYFYLRDEDGDFREIFTEEPFARFVCGWYKKLYKTFD